jgi:uncharacterized BrkB/YihY/UPF0761 family membrane protein
VKTGHNRALHFVMTHPARFTLQVFKAFRNNQGLLLAGAIAYYALLSIVPLLILVAIAFSHFVGEQLLLDTLARLLEWLVPGQSKAIVRGLANFLAHRAVIGWFLVVTMIFFSSLAFNSTGECAVDHLRASRGDPAQALFAVGDFALSV